MNKTHYEILSIPENATKEDIKKKYRKLASIYHPDKKNGDHKFFSEISHAFEILYDDSKRQNYDLELSFTRREEQERIKKEEEYNYYQKTKKTKESKVNYTFPDANNYEKLKEKPLNLFLKLSIEESQFGCNKRIDYERFIICPFCSGFGYGFLVNNQKVECMNCMGTGLKIKKESIKLRIHPNTIVGQKLRLNKKGNSSKSNPEFDGDIVINIVWKGNWDSRNKDIYTSFDVSKKDLKNGFFYFKNYDKEKLKIYLPKNINSGQKLKIEEKGWKAFSSDLYISITFKKGILKRIYDFFKF